MINSAKRIRIVGNLKDKSLKVLECEKIQTEYFHLCISRFSVITKSDGNLFLFFLSLEKSKYFLLFYQSYEHETHRNINTLHETDPVL